METKLSISFTRRFWSFIRLHPKLGCWVWTGALDGGGYGAFKLTSGGTIKAHRLSFQVFIQDLKPHQMVCHRCDKNYPKDSIEYRRCCNPDHLFVGTGVDNMQDALKKDRLDKSVWLKKGEENNKAVLTEVVVKYIRRKYKTGMTVTQIAKLVGFARTTVQDVVLNKTWIGVE